MHSFSWHDVWITRKWGLFFKILNFPLTFAIKVPSIKVSPLLDPEYPNVSLITPGRLWLQTSLTTISIKWVLRVIYVIMCKKYCLMSQLKISALMYDSSMCWVHENLPTSVSDTGLPLVSTQWTCAPYISFTWTSLCNFSLKHGSGSVNTKSLFMNTKCLFFLCKTRCKKHW